ncbi:hypothetical protein V8E52_008719 [Russula decolorans]
MSRQWDAMGGPGVEMCATIRRHRTGRSGGATRSRKGKEGNVGIRAVPCSIEISHARSPRPPPPGVGTSHDHRDDGQAGQHQSGPATSTGTSTITVIPNTHQISEWNRRARDVRVSPWTIANHIPIAPRSMNIILNAWSLRTMIPQISEPTLRESTTGESQPAVVKYGMCVNADDADAYEEGGGDDGAQAEMLLVAKRATRECEDSRVLRRGRLVAASESESVGRLSDSRNSERTRRKERRAFQEPATFPRAAHALPAYHSHYGLNL